MTKREGLKRGQGLYQVMSTAPPFGPSGNDSSSEDASNEDVIKYMKILDVAAALKEQHDELGKRLSDDDSKADLRKRLQGWDTKTGTETDVALMETAIADYFSNAFEFKGIEDPKQERLADMYINRGKIIKKKILPITIAGLIALSGWGLISGARKASIRSEERKVEEKVEQTYGLKQTLERQLSEVERESDNTLVLELAKDARTVLNDTDNFFHTYCRNGDAKDNVTVDNYKDVEANIEDITTTLRSSKLIADKTSSMVRGMRELESAKRTLDSRINNIDASKYTANMKEKARGMYTSMVNAANEGDIESAQAQNKQLSAYLQDIKTFSALIPQTQRAYASLKRTAVEDIAKQRTESLYEGAKTQMETADVARLRGSAAALDALDNLVGSAYKLRIVSRPGEKSGVWRQYGTRGNQNVSGYYIVVEAIGNNGRVIPMNITNEETGRTEKVTKWGERVAKSVYEGVGRDKQDDGIIQKNIVGEKEIGYLTTRFTMKGVDGKAQITRW